MTKTIVITGGSGFIGSHLKIGLGNRKSLKLINLSRSTHGNNLENIVKVKSDISAVIHLAAKTYIPDAFKNPYYMYKDNFLSTLNLLEFCRRNKVKKFIYMSSYVYGKPDYLPIDENHPTNIMNPYGKSKLICEKLCKSYCEDYGIKLIILRPFNIFGINQDSKFLIPLIIKQTLEENDQIKLNDLKPKRDYLYINDLIYLLETLINHDVKNYFSVYNIGSGVSYSVKQITENILNVFDVKKTIVTSGIKRKNEVLDCVANIENIQKDFKWSPTYSLVQGLQDLKSKII